MDSIPDVDGAISSVARIREGAVFQVVDHQSAELVI